MVVHTRLVKYERIGKCLESCVRKASRVKYWSIPSINTLDWHLSWLIFVDIQSSVDQYMSHSTPPTINQQLIERQLSGSQAIDQVSAEYQLLCFFFPHWRGVKFFWQQCAWIFFWYKYAWRIFPKSPILLEHQMIHPLHFVLYSTVVLLDVQLVNNFHSSHLTFYWTSFD